MLGEGEAAWFDIIDIYDQLLNCDQELCGAGRDEAHGPPSRTMDWRSGKNRL